MAVTIRRAALGAHALALAVFLALPLPAPAAGLNDTGQTNCYDAAGAVIVGCVGAADDGRYGRDAAATAGVLTKTGVGAAGFDFTKIANNGSTLAAGAALGSNPGDWACTRDNTTGLDWEVKVPGSGFGFREVDETFTWFNSIGSTNGGNAGLSNGGICSDGGQCDTEKFVANVNAANLCGHNDWRLPSAHELKSIVHYGSSSPSIDSTYFPNTSLAKPYWSATTAKNAVNAWAVTFQTGVSLALDKSMLFSVRLVRGGTPETSGACSAGNPRINVFESTPTSDFDIHNNGTVTHMKTGLMWKRCAEGQDWNGSTCVNGADTPNWSTALSTAEASTFAGHNDWRLPNVKELQSIVEACGYEPAINTTVFPNTPPNVADHFWSASTYMPSPGYAWGVAFGYAGEVTTNSGDKTGAKYVRLVRGGQFFDAFDALDSPDPFSFNPVNNAELSSIYVSNTVTVSGIAALAPISVTGGEYSVNGGSYTSDPNWVENGDEVTVHQTSAAAYSTLTTATLTIGGVSAPFKVTTKSIEVTITPSLDFGFQTVGTTSAAKTAVVTNNGAGPVSIVSIGDSGGNAGDFDDPVTGSTCEAGVTVLGAGESCQIGVTFMPAATGNRFATLDVGTSAGTLHAALSGTGTAPPSPPPEPPQPGLSSVVIMINNIAGGGNLTNPVTVKYSVGGCTDKEMFLVVNAPAMGIPWSYMNSQGQWVPLPSNLAQVQPWLTSGPYDGTHTLFSGNLPPGSYEIYLGCDNTKNGHLDINLSQQIDGVYGYGFGTVN